jgi:uncharacterized protein (DUF302 family)
MTSSSSLGFAATIAAPLDEAIGRTKEALKAEGFGVLTVIDVRETLQQKLGVEMEPYVILGACKPALAWKGLQAEPDLGLLLPCNVTVRETGGESVVIAVDPDAMLRAAGERPELKAVATEAAERLRRVAASLEGARD